MDEIAALKNLLLQRMRGNTDITALTADRIYDVPPVQPEEMTSPYIRFGQFTSSDDGAECFETYDIIGQIDVYSWGAGEAASSMQALRIAALIRSVIDEISEINDLDIGSDFVLTDLRFRSKRSITASDGKTKHVPITISAVVDKK